MSELTIIMSVLLVVFLGGSVIGLVLIRRQTKEKGKWGINFESVACPACGTSQPKVRVPTSKRQALWGGWTCRSCGCEMDKWGRLVHGLN